MFVSDPLHLRFLGGPVAAVSLPRNLLNHRRQALLIVVAVEGLPSM